MVAPPEQPLPPPNPATIITSQATETAERLAGFWIRLLALFIDSILYPLLSLPFVAAGVGIFLARQCYSLDGSFECYDNLQEPWSFVVMIALFVVGFLVGFVLYVIQMGHSGKTWGSKICGIRVVRAYGEGSIGFWRALGRTLFANIFSSAIIYLGYLWMLWDDRNQTWQDMVVKSIVIKDRR